MAEHPTKESGELEVTVPSQWDLDLKAENQRLRYVLDWTQRFSEKMGEQHPGFVWIERKARAALERHP